MVAARMLVAGHTVAAGHKAAADTPAVDIPVQDTPVEDTLRRLVDFDSTLDVRLGMRQGAVAVGCSSCLSC